MRLRNPLLASASPLSQTLHGVRRLADAGVGAVVLYSLFEEQLRREAENNELMAAQGSESYPESLTYFPPTVDSGSRAQRYLRLIERAAAAVDIPVIASLNASTPGSWARYARCMQDAGAAAIELNIYYLPGDAGVDSAAVEQRHLDVLAEVKTAATVPVAVKLSPYFSATADMVHRLDDAGADGLVLFNRFLQPDIDPETLSTVRTVALSTPADTRLPLTWIALLHRRIRACLAASTGVEHAADLAKYLLAGADVVQSASALLRHSPEYAGVLLQGLSDWLSRKGFQSVDEVRGLLAVPESADAEARERADYVWAVRKANSGFYENY
ncbi:dihydroorotate dehydrogenase-like protein [Mycobacterium simiae]|uniref:Dihydroorotate dehydrogenase-like protein n=1 Tax=Mycobacterium simiae TaxID=1784 RepID=A0A5B1BID4_MYCSI|nr:dihydroorotate dehydrogenase-like protein [Mycobacterium simiae]KAA1248408.1 dihydroorotate dehydrogenase-like protein [Mycobacterium simiae]